jgi:hypothetical protein
MSYWFRWVDADLIPHEEFVGLYSLDQTNATTLVAVIKDVLLRLNIPLNLCRGQCYDGASVMSGHRSGVASLILQVKVCLLLSISRLKYSLNSIINYTCAQISQMMFPDFVGKSQSTLCALLCSRFKSSNPRYYQTVYHLAKHSRHLPWKCKDD